MADYSPEKILLDVGLPKLSGIEAARRIRELSPASKILFLTQYRCREIAEEGLCTGASAYIVKSHAGGDLLRAVNTVLQGRCSGVKGDNGSLLNRR